MPSTIPKPSNGTTTRTDHRTTRESALRRFLDWLLGSVEAEFESAFDLEESAWRLAVATEGRFFNRRPGRARSGRVDVQGVSLQRITPTSQATTPTLFAGRFQTFNGRVYLNGRFRMPRQLRLEMALWFGFLVMFTAALTAPSSPWAQALPGWQLLIGAGLLAVGGVSVAVGRRQSVNDIPRLANVIANALSGTPESYGDKSA